MRAIGNGNTDAVEYEDLGTADNVDFLFLVHRDAVEVQDVGGDVVEVGLGVDKLLGREANGLVGDIVDEHGETHGNPALGEERLHVIEVGARLVGEKALEHVLTSSPHHLIEQPGSRVISR